jgi:hypothetical protein
MDEDGGAPRQRRAATILIRSLLDQGGGLPLALGEGEIPARSVGARVRG